MSLQVQVFRLETALFSVIELVELVICHRVIEIGARVSKGIEIQDVISDGGVIQRIEVQDVIRKSKDLGPISCLVGHRRERQIRWQELGSNGHGWAIRFASRVLLVFSLSNGT